MTTSERPRSRSRLPGLALAAALVTLAAAPARAEPDEQKAIQLFDKGRKLAREGRCGDAIAPLLESVRAVEGVGPLLNLGHCYETLGRTASAHRWFLRAEEVAKEKDDRRREEAAQRVRALEKDLSLLTVRVPAAIRSSAEIRVDGEPWPRKDWDVAAPIDPGTHTIEIVAPPHKKESATVVVRAKGDRVEWTAADPTIVEAPKAPPSPFFRSVDPPRSDAFPAAVEGRSSTQRTLGLVTGGLGLGGLAAGAIFGVISISAHSSVVGRCPNYPICSRSDRTELDDMNGRAELTGTISTIAVVTGAILLAGGAALFFTAPSR